MTLQQLEYIVALDNRRHFVKAAEDCYVTQPTLTMQVHKLEEEMGIKLFDRGKKPLQPTKAGEIIVLKARQILREVKEMKAYVRSENEDLKGEFRVGIIPTLAPYLLPRFINDFVISNPETLLKVRELQTDAIIDGLKSDMLDIGILVTPLKDQQIREVPVFYEPFTLYVGPGSSLYGKGEITVEELATEGLLLLDEGHCFREQALQLCESRTGAKTTGVEYESGSIATLMRMVDKGLGATLAPELAVTEMRGHPAVNRFSSPGPVREVSIVAHSSFTREKLIEELHRCILKNVPGDFRTMKKRFRVEWR